jgi:hypothetical protein
MHCLWFGSGELLMRGIVLPIFALAMALGVVCSVASAKAPEPSLYPVSWQLDFQHGLPKRVVVKDAAGTDRAYWYMTYTATNKTGKEQGFLPVFEMLTEEGKIIRSDNLIPPSVIETIRKHEGNKFIEGSIQVSGEIRLGEDQAKYGVAVWPEFTREMGHFSIFVGGLSGEYTTVTGADNKPVNLHKTLQLNFTVNGDEVYPGEDEVSRDRAEVWVMR